MKKETRSWFKIFANKRFLFKGYASRKIFWLVRCNIVVFSDLRCVEFTLGLFGVGILFQIYYSKTRDI